MLSQRGPTLSDVTLHFEHLCLGPGVLDLGATSTFVFGYVTTIHFFRFGTQVLFITFICQGTRTENIYLTQGQMYDVDVATSCGTQGQWCFPNETSHSKNGLSGAVRCFW